MNISVLHPHSDGGFEEFHLCVAEYDIAPCDIEMSVEEIEFGSLRLYSSILMVIRETLDVDMQINVISRVIQQ